jgi:hypothetical protein
MIHPELLHFAVKIRPLHAHAFGRKGHVPLARLELLFDVPGLEVVGRLGQGLRKIDSLRVTLSIGSRGTYEVDLGILDDFVGRQVSDPFDNVSQLADIAGPWMAGEPFFSRCVQGRFAAPDLGTKRRQEEVCQLQDVVGSVPQGWQIQGHDREAEVEVFAEFLLTDKID